MGMDCSGLVQVCFTAADIQLPRDSNEQVDQGENVSFIDEALPGDLAFFDDNEGNIVHVGIISGTRKIIHAFGFVREDTLDHQGIFNSETHAYSHKLRVIKRLID